MTDETTILPNAANPTDMVALIDVSLIDPNPLQPRGEVKPTDIEELSVSIRDNGLLQPLLVSPNNDRFILVAGYRRLCAAKAIGMRQVPCAIRKCSDAEMLQMALIENLQRSDLNPIEEGEAINQLMFTAKVDQRGAAEMLHKSGGFVSERVALLGLPSELKSMIIENRLPLRKALEIGKLKLSKSKLKLAEKADRFNLDELRAIVQQKLEKEKQGRKKRQKRDLLERDFRNILKSFPNVRVYKDRVSFSFQDEDDFLHILRDLLQRLESEF